MKLRCERDVLAEAIGIAGRAVSTKGTSLPVLAGVRMSLEGDRLAVTGSDLDLTITVTEPVAGSADGVTVVPARLAADIAKALEPGAVDLEAMGSEVVIRSGRSEFTLRAIPAEEFPQVPEPEGEGVTVQSQLLSEALSQVVPAASNDDSRPILTGVLFEATDTGLRLVATDSYRLAVRDLTGTTVLDPGTRILVPSRALAELGRILVSGESVSLVVGERDASFVAGRVRLTTRLIEGEFPNYAALIPERHPNRLTADKAELLEAIRRVRILARDGAPVRFKQSAEGLELEAISQDLGTAREVLQVDYEGGDLMVAFNPDYLWDGVSVTPGEKVLLETLDSTKPAVFRSPDRDDFTYLLMPVRVT
ncbi:MAG: DNA polymerase III subunit beta [Acidimicrobiales bacterium]|nr:MAG: DNA polymerase III subunit beta [Acidimicrobiales bacterium]